MKTNVVFCANLLAALALVPFILGCGGPRPVKVSGTVTLNGQPVEGAMVQFVPVKDGGRPATGLTTADGGFNLTTIENHDGALPGDYKVVITYNPPVESGPAQSTEQGMKEIMKLQEKAKRVKPKYVIPPAYTDASRTPLTQSVPTDGPIKIDIK
jgi:hypothetical protein